MLISEGLARRYFANENPLGHRITFDGTDYYSLVGVVADVHDEDIASKPLPQAYVVHAQAPFQRMALVVRARLDPLSLFQQCAENCVRWTRRVH